jgi:hypothetical protein
MDITFCLNKCDDNQSYKKHVFKIIVNEISIIHQIYLSIFLVML